MESLRPAHSLRMVIAAVATVTATLIEGFTFKAPQVDVKLFFQAAAIEARVGVILDEDVRGQLSVDAHNVDAVALMTKIAMDHSLFMQKVDLGAGRDNYVIAPMALLPTYTAALKKSMAVIANEQRMGSMTLKTIGLSGAVLLGSIEKEIRRPVTSDVQLRNETMNVKSVDPLKLLSVVAALGRAHLAHDGKGTASSLRIVSDDH